jgi:oligopeptide/dipeptide ABC transporter ATP-binding protein
MSQALLTVDQLKKHFPVTKGLLFATTVGWIKAVDGVSFSVAEGETLGIVGESGSGKTTTAKLILLLERPTSGSILYREKKLDELSRSELRQYRSAVQAVFQDPYSSLNPKMLVRDIVSEPLEINTDLPKQSVRERVAEMLQRVGLNPALARVYPHELSGGQRQRVALARALALQPRHIVLDEPVASLDVSIRHQIINLLKDLQEQFELSYLLISHDLATTRHLSHRVAVMYAGKIVEQGPSDELFAEPLHPYTQALLSAALPAHPAEKREEIVLAGEVPSPLNPPRGCRFHPRCPHAKPICSEVEPALKEVAPARKVACHLYGE